MKYKPDIREKALKFGMDYPDDEELVMLILGSGTKSLPVDSMARKIIAALDDFNEADWVKKILSVKGIGIGKALAVAAALELGKRRYCHLGAHVKSPQDIVPFVKSYAMNTKEHFLVITLNGGHNIIRIHVVSVGTINRTLIHPREVFVDAIRENAAAIILCHNHPSGNCVPSEDDLATTEMLINASKIVGIPILDHLIIDCNGYFSFLENDVLFLQEK
ncbi:MAG: DNA repair protein RadC [Treponema sp.]|nr:DNA repair protein RadC [Treponema sp.]